MKGKHILIVEDEIKIAQIQQDYLKHAGFTTTIISDGEQALPWLAKNRPDLILLDLMLPNKSGSEICTEIRRKSNVPIIMVTARVEEIDRIVGLEIGADDYICKPFNPKELVSRVTSTLKRILGLPLQSVSKIHLDTDKQTAQVGSSSIELTVIEFKLLEKLLSKPGQIFNRQQLLLNIDNRSHTLGEQTVDNHIDNVTQKLKILHPEKDFIQSIYSVGYKIIN